jgi:hypothetical protein
MKRNGFQTVPNEFQRPLRAYIGGRLGASIARLIPLLDFRMESSKTDAVIPMNEPEETPGSVVWTLRGTNLPISGGVKGGPARMENA